MRIIRVNRHSHDEAIVVLSTPPEMATDMGRFEPARYAADLRGYLIHNDAMPALYRFAKHVNAHIVDERRGTGEATQAHECAHCGQPGSVSKPPRFCPSCGQTWTPITYHEAAPALTQGTCSACGHQQAGRFPRCSACGGQMTYPPERHVRLPRKKLADPMPLSEALAETTAELARTAPLRHDHTDEGTTDE